MTKPEYERRTFPLRQVTSAVLLNWEFDGIDENMEIPMKRLITGMERPLWREDVE